MKKYINKLVLFCALLFLSASCESDNATLTTLANVDFTSAVIASPSNAINLTPENKYQTVVTISWPKVVYPIDAPVTYAIQIDVPADTIGATAWNKAVRIIVGDDVLSKSFLGGELNNMAKDLGLKIDVPGELVVRIQANLDRAVYSSPIALTLTPFVEPITLTEIYVPGQYSDGDASKSAKLLAIESGVFQGFLYFPPNELEFKFALDAEGKILYGLNSDGNLALGGETNLSVPATGTYQITTNLNTVSYTAVPYAWDIVGPALFTPEKNASTTPLYGWEHSIPMAYDYKDNTWKITAYLYPGALKFRLNGSWDVNYGSKNGESGEITNGLVYLDNSGSHTINEAGTYEVTYFLSAAKPPTATYSIKKL